MDSSCSLSPWMLTLIWCVASEMSKFDPLQGEEEAEPPSQAEQRLDVSLPHDSHNALCAELAEKLKFKYLIGPWLMSCPLWLK